MTIPFKMSPLGRGKILPNGYIEAEFIQNTGSQVFKLVQTETKVTSYEIIFSFVGATYNYGAIFSNLISDNNALTTTRLVHVDENKGWLFFLRQPNNSNAYMVSNIGHDGTRCFLKVDSTKAIFNNQDFLPSTPSVTSTNPNEIGIFANNSTTYNPTSSIFRVYRFTFYEGTLKSTDIVPVLSVYGEPCFYDKSRKKIYKGIGSAPAIVGLTLAQALNLSKLPATGGTLTVSLPWEAQLVITGVPAALQVAAGKGWTITVQYREPEADNEYYNKYAECVTVNDMLAVNADYKNDLTKDGEWVYPLPELNNSAGAFARSADLVSFDADLLELTWGVSMFRNMPKMEKFKGSLKALINGQEMFCYSYSFTVFDSTLESLTEGIYMFMGCQLNKESALKILHSLPSYTTKTHNFHIGIHVDYKQDDEVLAAIAAAEAKGWNVGVQWNGTATAQTASTFGLRKPPIYAKLGTVERPDGTSEQILDWGHYVTDWEANGYREFASVEEAKEYFNIIDEA